MIPAASRPTLRLSFFAALAALSLAGADPAAAQNGFTPPGLGLAPPVPGPVVPPFDDEDPEEEFEEDLEDDDFVEVDPSDDGFGHGPRGGRFMREAFGLAREMIAASAAQNGGSSAQVDQCVATAQNQGQSFEDALTLCYCMFSPNKPEGC